MIRWCWEAAAAAPGVDEVVVATEDARIADAVAGFGGRVAMTSPDHATGSDRVAELARTLAADAIINLQGDEPLLRAEDVGRLAATMREDPAVNVATLAHPISPAEAENPNRVKVVVDGQGGALYFSRAAIPHGEGARHLQHVGVYAYRTETLLAFPHLPRPPEEVSERLEQLRLLAARIPIRVLEVARTGPGVDVPADIAAVEALLADRVPPGA